MTIRRAVLLVLLAGIVACGDTVPEPPSVTIYVAASTADVMGELAADIEGAHGIRVRINAASSSSLGRQIEAGAPCDLYLSANPDWMDHVEETGRLSPGSRRNLLGGRLVLIAPRGRSFEPRFEPGSDLSGAFAGRLALGDPLHVPAGQYAEAALRHMGWWPQIDGRLSPTHDVRAALRMVELGEAGAGIVYATDVGASRKVVVVGTFDAASHPPIRYPVALIGEPSPEARKVYDHLLGAEAAEVFRRHGFDVVD